MNAFDSSHELLVVFKFSSYLGWLATEDLHAVASVELPSHAHELLVDHNRRRAYVSIYGNGVYGNNTQAGNQLAVVDLTQRRLLEVVDLGENRGSHGLAFDPHDNVLVSCDRTASVAVVDAETLAVDDVISIDAWATPHWIVSSGDRKKAYTSNKATPYVSVLNVDTRTPLGQVPVPTGTEGLALSRDGRRLFVADHSGAGLPVATTKQPVLHVIDTSTDEIITTVPLSLPPLDADVNHELRVAVSPDDAHVLVSAHGWHKVLIVDANALSEQRSLDVDGGPMGFAFEPHYGSERRWCLVTNHDIGQISRIDVDDARVIDRRTPTGVEHQGPEVMEFISDDGSAK